MKNTLSDDDDSNNSIELNKSTNHNPTNTSCISNDKKESLGIQTTSIRNVGDAYARCRTGNTAGRGSIAGWTPCPFCSYLQIGTPIFINHSSPMHWSDDCIIKIMTMVTGDNNCNTPGSTTSNTKVTKSLKLFTHGRGLAAHLHAVHTPWNPGKAELKRRKVLQQRIKIQQRLNESKDDDHKSSNIKTANNGRSMDNVDYHERLQKRPKLVHNDDNNTTTNIILSLNKNNNTQKEKWEPTEEEAQQWNERVMDIVNLVSTIHTSATKHNPQTQITQHTEQNEKEAKEEHDRSGNTFLSYRQSLPPFLAAAAEGDLEALQKCIDENDDPDQNLDVEKFDTTIKSLSSSIDPKRQAHICNLLSLQDRNGSTAEHWAAGGGHLDIFSYLLTLRDIVYNNDDGNDNSVLVDDTTDSASTSDDYSTTQYNTNHSNKKIRKRRDGKTSLHYAARNGHNDVIDLILSRHDAPPVDIPSGDGTTPLHLACYGGHLSTVQHLVKNHHANEFAINEWECGSSHWVAMSIGLAGNEELIELCEYLKKRGVDFISRQKQGHAALHKAASRKNRVVIEWLAKSSCFSEKERKSMGIPDVGGNTPSDIFLSVGGEREFALWMKDTLEW